jgi:hypothetical protein
VILKYANCIITKPLPPRPGFKGAPGLQQVLALNGEILKGAFHISCAWISPGPNPGVYPAHTHPHGEMIGFIGTNPDDPTDLGGEAELWIDDEQYFITESFLAFFPKDILHCPLMVTNVKRPIFHFDIQMTDGKPIFDWLNEAP